MGIPHEDVDGERAKAHKGMGRLPAPTDPQCWGAGVCAGCDGIALNLSNEEQEHGRQADSDDSSALHAETGSEARSEVATVCGTTVGPTVLYDGAVRLGHCQVERTVRSKW